MVNNPIPGVLINAKIYNDGREQMGVGKVQLPDFEYLSESLTGLGLAGEIDMPVLGHFGSLTMSLNWNTVCEQAVSLLAPKTHRLTLYGSVQNWATESGAFEPRGVKVAVHAIPKKSGPGSFEAAKKTEPASEFELTYVKMTIGGKEILEIDKFNFICRINGKDYLSDVRQQLGM